MTKEKINISEVIQDPNIETFEFPKYVTQILNLANQNAKGTRPKVVGQLSESINNLPKKTPEEWKKYYLANHKKQLDEATEKVWNMLQNLKEAIEKIDKKMIRNWVYDLVINKTAEGFIIQEFILKYLSKKFNKSYRLATPKEESKGIDGFIGDIPVQIKSKSYKMKTNVKNEKMDIFIIFYSKTNKYLIIEYDESIFQKT